MSGRLDDLARFGFRWGPAAIWRSAIIRGCRFLVITTEHHVVEVSISPSGRSLRVWLDGKALT